MTSQFFSSSKLSEHVRAGIELWNEGNIPALLQLLAADVAFSSPRVEGADSGGSSWLQGRQEVAMHKLAMRKHFPRLELDEIHFGAGFATVMLRHDTGRLSLFVEPDEQMKARRIMVCHSAPET